MLNNCAATVRTIIKVLFYISVAFRTYLHNDTSYYYKIYKSPAVENQLPEFVFAVFIGEGGTETESAGREE